MDVGAIAGLPTILARLLPGLVFLIAGGGKLFDPAGFSRAVRSYEIIPERLTTPVATTLPALECVVGLCLVIGLFTQVAAAVALLLLVGFTVAAALVLAQGRVVDCGCFGQSHRGALGLRHIGRNLALILLTAAAFVYPL